MIFEVKSSGYIADSLEVAHNSPNTLIERIFMDLK